MHRTIRRKTSRSSCRSLPAERRTRFRASSPKDCGEKWNQAVIIENKSGAGGNIGAEAVASSPPDGYTLFASPPGPLAINESLYKKLAFRPSDFMPITVLGTAPVVLDVRPDFPAKTVQELIAYAKANPGKVTFASQGNGSTSHLTALLFEKLTGTKMVHVPYRGTAPALQDIMGNTVDLFFDNIGSSMSLHLGGKLRILGVCGTDRAPSLPDVPTVREVRRCRFRFRDLVCPDGAEGNAGCHHCEAQFGGDRNPWGARHPGSIRQARRSAGADGRACNGEVHRRGAKRGGAISSSRPTSTLE